MTCLIWKAKDIYIEHLQAEFGEPRGCSGDDVEKLAMTFACSLPRAYMEYLLWMGSDATGVFRGSEWFCNNVIRNTASLPELLQGNGIVFERQGKPLCFFSHQGYMKAWLYLPCADDDPECYFFSEGSSPLRVESVGKFSDFLLEDLMGLVCRRLAR